MCKTTAKGKPNLLCGQWRTLHRAQKCQDCSWPYWEDALNNTIKTWHLPCKNICSCLLLSKQIQATFNVWLHKEPQDLKTTACLENKWICKLSPEIIPRSEIQGAFHAVSLHLHEDLCYQNPPPTHMLPSSFIFHYLRATNDCLAWCEVVISTSL